jgi:hypothetical protein
MLNKEMLSPLNHNQFKSLHVPQQNLIQTIKCGEACQLMTLAKEHGCNHHVLPRLKGAVKEASSGAILEISIT